MIAYLVLGAILGFAFTKLALIVGLRRGQAVVIKWRSGIGRCRVLRRTANEFLVSSPLMRDALPLPAVGEQLVYRFEGRRARAGILLDDADGHWLIRPKN